MGNENTVAYLLKYKNCEQGLLSWLNVVPIKNVLRLFQSNEDTRSVHTQLSAQAWIFKRTHSKPVFWGIWLVIRDFSRRKLPHWLCTCVTRFLIRSLLCMYLCAGQRLETAGWNFTSSSETKQRNDRDVSSIKKKRKVRQQTFWVFVKLRHNHRIMYHCY